MSLFVDRGVLTLLATGVTTGSTIGIVPSPKIKYHRIITVSSVGVSAGTLSIDTSADPDFTGTWASINTVTVTPADAVKQITAVGVLAAVRGRLTVNVANGTIDIYYLGT